MLHRWLQLLFPRNCLSTGQAVSEDSPCPDFCTTTCKEGFYFIREPYCHRCGNPFWGVVEGLRECPTCHALKPVFTEGRSLFLLRAAGRELVHEYKYHRQRYLERDIRALLLAEPALVDFARASVLVPVPLHRSRLHWRGFNQAASIAEMLGELSETPVQHLLERRKATQIQSRLSRAERARNMQGAFAMAKEQTLDPQRRYVLVDDVFTTGSTLNACAKTLQRAGALHIGVATLAHG